MPLLACSAGMINWFSPSIMIKDGIPIGKIPAMQELLLPLNSIKAHLKYLLKLMSGQLLNSLLKQEISTPLVTETHNIFSLKILKAISKRLLMFLSVRTCVFPDLLLYY